MGVEWALGSGNRDRARATPKATADRQDILHKLGSLKQVRGCLLPSRPGGPTLEMWRLQKVCEKTGLGKSSVWQMVKDGVFPKQRQLCGVAVAWRSDEVIARMDARPEAD